MPEPPRSAERGLGVLPVPVTSGTPCPARDAVSWMRRPGSGPRPTSEGERPVPAPRNVTDPPATRRSGHPTAILAIICISYFMVILDNSIIFTGLPRIEAAMGFSPTGLTSGAGCLHSRVRRAAAARGRAGPDIVGRRRMFVIGLVLFGAASFLVGAAQRGVASRRRFFRAGGGVVLFLALWFRGGGGRGGGGFGGGGFGGGLGLGWGGVVGFGGGFFWCRDRVLGGGVFCGGQGGRLTGGGWGPWGGGGSVWGAAGGRGGLGGLCSGASSRGLVLRRAGRSSLLLSSAPGPLLVRVLYFARWVFFSSR